MQFARQGSLPGEPFGERFFGMACAPRVGVMRRWLCGLVAALAAAGAQAEDTRHYFKFDVGPNYTGDLHQEFKNIPVERDLRMNLGVRGSVAEGFVLNRFMALEFEAAAVWNELDESFDWLLQVPVLANVLFRYECKGGWTAYLGIGAGGAAVIANSTGLSDDNDLTFVPAWQGTAGVSYRMGGNVSIGLVYKYMGLADPKLELTILGMSQVFKLEDVQNHYGGLQLTYSF